MLTNDELEHMEIRYNLAYTIPIKADVLSLLAHIRHLENAPGKVVAGEGWRVRYFAALGNYTEALERVLDSGDARDADYCTTRHEELKAILDEVTELPEPTDITTQVIDSPLTGQKIVRFTFAGSSHMISFDNALKLAAALIAAATQPQKGNEPNG